MLKYYRHITNKNVYKHFKNRKVYNKYILISYSLWGKDNIDVLKEYHNKKMLFIFGNEKRGLKKSTMDLSQRVISIGNKQSSEPLRATQAAAFALGYLYNL